MDTRPPTIDYAFARPPERSWWRPGLAAIAAAINATVAVATVIWATGLAPQYGDATSRYGVIEPLIFPKLPLLAFATFSVGVVAKRFNKPLGRLALGSAWCVVAVWISITVLFFD